MRIRFNPTSGLRDPVDGSPCSYEVETSDDRTHRMSRRACLELFTADEVNCACTHPYTWVCCPRDSSVASDAESASSEELEAAGEVFDKLCRCGNPTTDDEEGEPYVKCGTCDAALADPRLEGGGA